MRKSIFRRRPGEGTPMILAIVLILLMLFCTIAEFCRVWIIAQGIKEATQQAVISTVNDNYDDVYHAVREGYAAGWYPDGTGRWDESVDTGDVYGQLSETLPGRMDGHPKRIGLGSLPRTRKQRCDSLRGLCFGGHRSGASGRIRKKSSPKFGRGLSKAI